MPDKRFSDLSSSASFGSIWLPGYDLTREVGDQNVKFGVSTLMSAIGGVTSVVPIVTLTSGIEVAAFDEAVSVQLNFPALPTTDVTVLNLHLKSPTIAAATYNLQIFGGEPSTGGVLLFDYAATTGGINIGADGLWDYEHPQVLYLPAAAGSNEIWVRIISQDINPVTLNAQIITMEYAGGGGALPGWVDPPPYTGPLMDDVYVGPTREFIEPRFGLQALNDGGTMHIDGGAYYYPFGVSWDPAIAHDLRYGYNSGQGAAGLASRFVNGITIIGSGTYNSTPTIFNGRGGYGMQASHPFRMIRGQGFMYCNSPVTCTDVRFMFCGGYDQTSDGEAGAYASTFQSEGAMTLIRCAFDGNENGIFAQFWHGDTPGETDISNATGNSRFITVNVDHCDFGYLLPNGGGGDGYSQDFYLNNMTVHVTASHFYGVLAEWENWPGVCPPMRKNNTIPGYHATPPGPCTSGNNLKARSRYFTVDGCYVRCNSGKMIDRPDGGDCVVTNTVFVSLEPSISNCLAYNSEATYPIPLFDPVFQNCTFHLGREIAYGSIWWMGAAGHKFDCSHAGNRIIWQSSKSGLVVNRTNGTYNVDFTALSGLTADYVVGPNDENLKPSPTATIAPPPPAPLPASLKAGDTLGPGIGPLVP